MNTSNLNLIKKALLRPFQIQITGAPEGFDALLLARLAGEAPGGADILFVGRDDRRMARIAEALAFMGACGLTADEVPEVYQTDFYTSHEVLLLGAEEAMTRVDSTSGDWYEGGWLHGRMHGRGIMYWAGGNRYAGEYRDNRMHGHGVYSWASGDRYEGEYAGDLRHGKGTLVFASGDHYEGGFLGDEYHGMGKYLYANGDQYSEPCQTVFVS